MQNKQRLRPSKTIIILAITEWPVLCRGNEKKKLSIYVKR